MWVVVFSPTGCEAMLRTLNLFPAEGQSGEEVVEERQLSTLSTGRKEQRPGRKQRLCYVATIGPTTRDHLRAKFGFEPDVCAEKPSPEGVATGIERFIAGVGRGRKE